jgi:ornithine cyclodeaminase/alanine dehydrogenase-like protein (mu-crystallin family)
MASASVVVDVLEQCVVMGDLRAAIAAGAMTAADVDADLGDIVTGKKRGRRDADEIIVFDSTGTGLEDVAAAALVYERALDARAGRMIALGAA